MPVREINIRGLAEFQRELRRAGAGFPRELRRLNLDAAQMVVTETEKRGRALGGVHAKTVRAGAFKARAEQRRAKVVIDASTKRNAFAFGAEFGSKRYHQFPAWRGNQWLPDAGGVGYMLHPAVRETRDEIIDIYAELITQLARRAFPDGASPDTQ